MSLTPLFEISVVLTEVGLLLVHGSNFGRMLFLPIQWLAWVPVGVAPGLARYKSVT